MFFTLVLPAAFVSPAGFSTDPPRIHSLPRCDYHPRNQRECLRELLLTISQLSGKRREEMLTKKEKGVTDPRGAV